MEGFENFESDVIASIEVAILKFEEQYKIILTPKERIIFKVAFCMGSVNEIDEFREQFKAK